MDDALDMPVLVADLPYEVTRDTLRRMRLLGEEPSEAGRATERDDEEQ